MKILNTNKRCYPKEAYTINGSVIEDAGYVEITAVLTEGEIGDFAVYVGDGSPEWVARLGDKLSWEEATCYFPCIPEEKYRN